MNSMRHLLPRLLVLSVWIAMTASVAMAQVKMRNTGPFVNLKLLKPAEVESQMYAFNLAEGTVCGHCHMPANYATEENPNYGIARQMIVLTRDINAKYFDGAELVTCYTCHQGAAMVKVKPE